MARMNKRAIKDIFLRAINWFVKTDKYSIFTLALENASKDCYDILNCNSSNLMRLLNRVCETPHKKKVTIYVSYYDDKRLDAYKAFSEVAAKNNVDLVFYKEMRDSLSVHNAIKRLKIDLYRFKSATWINESGGTFFAGKNKDQHIICLNYFISCKEDYQVGKERKWEFLDYLTTTALLPTQITCASNGSLLGNCHITGFPRNDTLLGYEKRETVIEWIKNRVGYYPRFIFVYAPTYRDYEMTSLESRPLFGYDVSGLDQLLKDYEAVLVYKLHPYQNDTIIKNGSMLKYEANYSFSLYDLLAVSSCLICDYSSVAFDYLLTNRPIIYNLYDLEKYETFRGLSYRPYEKFCYGEIVRNREGLVEAITRVLKGEDKFQELRNENIYLFHEITDCNATKRVYDDVNQFIGNIL